MTFRTFSTQRIESWHAAFKQMLGTRKKILEVCKLLDAKWKMVWNEGEEMQLRRSARNAAMSDVPIVAAVSKKLSNEALDRLRVYHEAATKLIAVEGHMLAGEQVYYVASTKDQLVSVFAHTSDQVKYSGFIIFDYCMGNWTDVVFCSQDSGNHVEATTTWCSRRCEKNAGMPCQHILQACIHAHLHEVPLEQFSGFWKEDPEVKRFVHIYEDDEDDAVAFADADADADADAEGEGEGEGGGHGAEPICVEVDAQGVPIIPAKAVRKRERSAILHQSARAFAELGATNAACFERAQQLQQEMYEQLISEFAVNKRGSAGGNTGETGGVRNPVKLPTKGKLAHKRKVKGVGTAASKRKKR